MQKFILCIYVFLEKLKSMIQQHTHKTGLNMTCWSNEKGKNFKCPHTPHWNLTQSCIVSHVQELASVWMQSCHVHSCRNCESLLLGFCKVGCSYHLHNPQARRLRARTVGCSTPPHCPPPHCPPPALPGQATRAATVSCVGFAGP